MTDAELLKAALDESARDWEKVHEVCTDRTRAAALAGMLERNANKGNEAAEAWAHVLAELHPGLTVHLPPAGPRSA